MQRVEKTGGSNAGEVVYFNGHPLALLNPSGNSWTDLIWAGSDLLAEVPGSQAGSAVYRLLDHEGSLAATVNSAGGILTTNLFTPYGQLMNSGAGDAYSWTGLFQDSEYSGDAAWYRNYSTRQARWLTPDPYNGSYDLYDPQSFNRYMYVSGNPLGFTDPSGLAGAGILTGIGGNLCLGYIDAGINPCDPIISVISNGLFNSAAYVPFLSFAVAVGCGFGSSSDTKSSLCGQSGWTALISKDHPDLSTAINDAVALTGIVTSFALANAVATASAASIAAGGAGITTASYLWSCVTGPSNPVCDVALALIAYTALNDIFSVVWDIFGGSPKFTGSLLPRPSDLGGLGTAPIGIPNQNLSITGILGQPSRSSVPAPGMNVR